MFDETSDQRRLKLCNIVDEYTREALAIRVDRTCTAEDLVGVIQDLVLTRGAPEYLRADNGPELIAWALREGVSDSLCRHVLTFGLGGLAPRGQPSRLVREEHHAYRCTHEKCRAGRFVPSWGPAVG